MEELIKIVKSRYPRAICEQSQEYGFTIWTASEFAKPYVKIIGMADTEILAWDMAAKTVTKENLPIHPDFKK